MGIRHKIDDKDVLDGLARLERAARNPAPALRSIGVELVASTQERFEAARGPDGQPWTPLQPAYAASKRGPGILREMGIAGGLMGSITYEVDGTSLAVGSNKIHAAVHQLGAVITPVRADALVFMLGNRLVRTKKVTIPARPYLGISDGDRSEIAATFERFLGDAFRGD